MVKENIRTLNNTSYKGKKKLSKKSSKKNSKKNISKDISTTEEMLQILNSDTDVYQQKNNKFQNKLVPYNGEMHEQFINTNQQQMNQPQMNQQLMNQPHMNQQQMIQQQMNQQQMNQQQMNHFGAISPLNYDPLMLQQIAPLQTTQNFENHGMPSNFTSNNMFSNLAALSAGPNVGNTMGNNLSSQLPNNLDNTVPNQYSPMPQNNINLNNLNMLGNNRL